MTTPARSAALKIGGTTLRLACKTTQYAIAKDGPAVMDETRIEASCRFPVREKNHDAEITGIAPARLWALLSEIEAHCSDRRTTSELARACGITATMRRAFRVSTGRTIHEYRTVVRVARGVRALALTDDKVSAIASDVGYVSKKDFYHALERHVGLLPKEIRALSLIERIRIADAVAQQLMARQR